MPRELHHNTYEQVRAYVESALTVVDELGVEGDLRVPAFSAAVNLFASKQVFIEQDEVSPVLRGVPLHGRGSNGDLRG